MASGPSTVAHADHAIGFFNIASVIFCQRIAYRMRDSFILQILCKNLEASGLGSAALQSAVGCRVSCLCYVALSAALQLIILLCCISKCQLRTGHGWC